MAIFGILIVKSSPLNPEFVNRYYTDQLLISQAMSVGEAIYNAERECHSTSVTFERIHVWAVGSNPNMFDNLPLLSSGLVASSPAIPSWICAELQFGVPNSYVNYKRYRVQVNAATINGTEWSTGMLANITTTRDALAAVLEDLCTHDGTPYSSVIVNPNLEHLQEGKSWYNRATV